MTIFFTMEVQESVEQAIPAATFIVMPLDPEMMIFLYLVHSQEDVEEFMKKEESVEAALKRTQSNYRYVLHFFIHLLISLYF